MIDLYTWSTPNGRKVSIMLEECALPYRVHKVNIGTNSEQFTPQYLKIDPNGKIPSIRSRGPGWQADRHDGTGRDSDLPRGEDRKVLPEEGPLPGAAVAHVPDGGGPMFSQSHHFTRAKKDEVPCGSERCGNEAKRLYCAMDARLAKQAHFAGEHSIADIAIYPWVARHEWHRVELAAFPSVQRWYEALGARPALARGMAVPS